MHANIHTQNRLNEFVRLQLEVDVLVALPEDEAGGPVGRHDTYFNFGMRWWTLICSGVNFASVSETTRRIIAPNVNNDLTLDDCVAGMTEIRRHLMSVDEAEYAKTVDGMLRARRSVRGGHANTPGPAAAPSAAGTLDLPGTCGTHRKQHTRSNTAEHRATGNRQTGVGSGGRDQLVLTEDQYRLQVHLAESAIDALRTEPRDSAPEWEPAGHDGRLVGIGEAYSVWHHLALAYLAGDARGLARARDIFDPHPPMSPIQALGGLQDTYRRLKALSDEDRVTAFAAVDFCLRWFDPVEK